MKTKGLIKHFEEKIFTIELRHIFFVKPSMPADRYFNLPYSNSIFLAFVRLLNKRAVFYTTYFLISKISFRYIADMRYFYGISWIYFYRSTVFIWTKFSNIKLNFILLCLGINSVNFFLNYKNSFYINIHKLAPS